MTRMNQDPIRILQVLGGMHRGGPETWLMHILRPLDRQRFQMDFLVHTDQPCAYDEEIGALGGKVIPCLSPQNPFAYARNFKRILRELGPYDVVHSEVQYFSGFVLRLAYQAGVPVRIAHNHTPSYHHIDAITRKKQGLWRRSYIALMKRWIRRYATAGLVVNREGGPDMFGAAWEKDPRFRILYCGVDLAPFGQKVEPLAVRGELGIPPDAFVLGNVSRFFKVKNHTFMLEILSQLVQYEPRVHLLLVGDGPLYGDIEKQVVQAGLRDRVIFAGSRPDAPRLMLGAMDVFLFPSNWGEGLPLVMIEAQAAGLPCIISNHLTEEANIVRPLIRRVSLDQPPSSWAETILAAQHALPSMDQAEALEIVQGSPFNITRSMAELMRVYETAR
jgi:glycosyltransferase involved in cell wall biosynthesis